MRVPTPPTGAVRSGLVAALAGALVAIVLGLLTFGAQATVAPHHLPLAVAIPGGPAGQALTPVLGQLDVRGGDAVAWQRSDPAGARQLLDDGSVYGVLQLAPNAAGSLTATAVVSGAANPNATSVAQQVLVTAGQGVLDAAAARVPGTVAAPVAVETVHPTAPAGKVFPLAAGALLWLATLVGSLLAQLLARRDGRRPSRATRLAGIAAISVLGPAVVVGFAKLWDSELVIPWQAIAFLVLVTAAFACVQGALLRLLGIAAVPILAVLYLTAPAVAAQPPELLQPVYRVLLWSWSPFRFATDSLRALVFGDGGTPGVGTAVLLFAVLAVGGLAVLLWPNRRSRTAPPSTVTNTAPEPAIAK